MPYHDAHKSKEEVAGPGYAEVDQSKIHLLTTLESLLRAAYTAGPRQGLPPGVASNFKNGATLGYGGKEKQTR
jgi:hypothetical protein